MLWCIKLGMMRRGLHLICAAMEFLISVRSILVRGEGGCEVEVLFFIDV